MLQIGRTDGYHGTVWCRQILVTQHSDGIHVSETAIIDHRRIGVECVVWVLQSQRRHRRCEHEPGQARRQEVQQNVQLHSAGRQFVSHIYGARNNAAGH